MENNALNTKIVSMLRNREPSSDVHYVLEMLLFDAKYINIFNNLCTIEEFIKLFEGAHLEDKVLSLSGKVESLDLFWYVGLINKEDVTEDLIKKHELHNPIQIVTDSGELYVVVSDVE